MHKLSWNGSEFLRGSQHIHSGLPWEMITFVQQIGRCGRDGSFSPLKKVEHHLVKIWKDDNECRRSNSCKTYLNEKIHVLPTY